MNGIRHEFGRCIIVRVYDEDDPIWQLPEEARRRRMLADVQRDLEHEAERLAGGDDGSPAS